jgi:branched-chain amino acid transport system permease protein
MSVADHAPRLAERVDQRIWFERIPTAWWIVGLILLFLPVVANSFWLFQVMGWTFILGMIGLSLMFLAGYGGMVSLLQMSIAGMAGYMVAILGPSGVLNVSLGLSWWIVLPAAFLIAALFATISGALAVRTEGIYTIMITLAIAAAFFYFTRQNYSVFNGYSGFNLVLPPQLFGVNWREPVAFYYLCLASATLCYCAVVYVERSPFRACATTRAAWLHWAST